MPDPAPVLTKPFDFSQEFELLVRAYEQSGGKPDVLRNSNFASLAVHGNHVLGSKTVPGLHVETEEMPTGVRVRVVVEPEARIPQPVHLCFGLIPQEGIQEIVSLFEIGDGAEVSFVAHCTFPNALRVRHVMDARIIVGRGAKMVYRETHYHGEQGGSEVLPKTRATVSAGGVLQSEFKLVKGTVGKLDLDFEAEVADKGICEVAAKVYGKRQDKIVVRESLLLRGAGAKGLAKSRIAVTDQAHSEVLGEIVGEGPFSRGHVDCVEVIRGSEAMASAVPRLLVRHDTAKLTHEAAIGSVDKKQLETLMARGLTEEEATDVIVGGMLR
ncbi:MAG: SufD family Fe-S cluster assembly protein [candidate division KSB1 bacterium]|nr:SufD family Fe-S cluster assembly protein [candidate division KSB1 bacterium]